MNTENEKQLVEFHIGRGGRFNNQGHLTFCGVGNDAKRDVENKNFLAFENESEIIETHGDDVVDLITDLDYNTESVEYKEFCEKYGNLGAVVLNSCDGNYIGDKVEDNNNYHYNEDGPYDTTYGVLVDSFEDLSENEQHAILESPVRWKFEQAFDVELPEMEDK